jgi:hypothetical protein
MRSITTTGTSVRPELLGAGWRHSQVVLPRPTALMVLRAKMLILLWIDIAKDASLRRRWVMSRATQGPEQRLY